MFKITKSLDKKSIANFSFVVFICFVFLFINVAAKSQTLVSPIAKDRNLLGMSSRKKPVEDKKEESKKEDLPSIVQEAIFKDIEETNKVSSVELKVTEATKEIWANGCLGLAKQDEFCTQAIVPGWRVSVIKDDITWIYRTNERGTNLRIEK